MRPTWRVMVQDASKATIVFAVARPQSTGSVVKPPPLKDGGRL